MWINFANKQTAQSKLTAKGYKQISNGAWVSKCKCFKATLHPAGNECVVCYSEI
jgi:hypothetical protein